jgi:hypothetical protein
MIGLASTLGRVTIRGFAALGHAAFFFLDLLRHVPASLRRFGLVVVQVHAIGYRSLVIILASGLAVGCVLALQMYYALVPYGASESLGLVVNLSLVRELGPVVAGLLFAYPFEMLALVVISYLALIPLSAARYRKLEREHAAASAVPVELQPEVAGPEAI